MSDRICVLQLNIENTPRSAEEYKKSRSEFRPTLYTIINLYAPTTERRQKYPDEFETFYKDLTNTIKDIGKKTVLLLSGDFNAKVGQFTEGDNSIGKYLKGRSKELKEVRTVIGKHKSPLEEKIPREIANADDVDFVGLEYIDIDAVQRTLHKYNLKVNIDKTEKTSLSKNEDAWRSTKKVGSLMGDKEDVERRKQLSNAALYKLKNIWIGKGKINHNIKIKLYKALVKPILTYNCGTWALAQTELNKLDAFHRKQIRKLLNIYYPTKISNKTLYKKCNENPLSTHILESRWRLFGHILCRNEEIPANKAMQLYFHRTEKRFRGRPTTTLPVIINKDLSQIQDNLSLKSTDDLK